MSGYLTSNLGIRILESASSRRFDTREPIHAQVGNRVVAGEHTRRDRGDQDQAPCNAGDGDRTRELAETRG